MRSRYTAYCLSLAKYIIKTTHEDNPDFTDDLIQWENEILEFSKNYTFEKLTIMEHSEQIDQKYAFVTFKATIRSKTQDHSFIEKSRFEKINNNWLYHSAQ